MSASPISLAASFAIRAGIDAVCLLTSDEETVMMARNSPFGLGGKPLAQSMLDHYLEGSGKDVIVKTADLFQADPSVAAHFIREVKIQLAAANADGNVPVKQSVYSNQDWRNALGSINLQWKAVKKGVVEVWFINRYRWHPEASRVTQCVHQAADNLRTRKTRPAAEFDMIGTHYRLVP